MKKRTGFESALVRRVAKKGDFLRYIAFESGLEALAAKRMQRLSDRLQIFLALTSY
jgi:U3 small nucleolar RNA-associated protein 6